MLHSREVTRSLNLTLTPTLTLILTLTREVLGPLGDIVGPDVDYLYTKVLSSTTSK